MLKRIWQWPELGDRDREIADLAWRVARDEVAPRATRHDEERTFVRDSLEALAEAGLFGTNIPEQYGGRGGSDLAAVIVLEAVSAACGSTGASLCFHLLTNHLIDSAGPQALRDKYLPRLASNMLGAFSLNERTEIPLTAVGARAEDRGDHWLLNGFKPFVTTAGEADLYICYATDPSDAHPAITQQWVLVEATFDGVTTPVVYEPLGLRGASNGQMRFDAVRIPKENMLGEEPWGGVRGLVAKEESALGPQVVGMGCAAAAYEAAVHHARTNDLPEWMLQQLGPLGARLNAWRCFEAMGARNMGGGFPLTVQTQIETKTMGGADATWICDQAIEIIGGGSLMRSSPVQRYFRDARTAAFLMLPMDSRRHRAGLHACELDAAVEHDAPTMQWEPAADHIFRMARGRVDIDTSLPEVAKQAISRQTVEALAREAGDKVVSLDTFCQHLTRIWQFAKSAQAGQEGKKETTGTGTSSAPG
jgi:alkylation response protein AidB-like acyl-CoA dehydrogenase